MAEIYKTTRGRHALSLRVSQLLGLDEVVEVLCRSLSRDYGHDLDEADVSRMPRADVERQLRDELAFGGYAAYGHRWEDNVEGDSDDFYERVKARVLAIYPALEG